MKPHVSRCTCGCHQWLVTDGKPTLLKGSCRPINEVVIQPRWRDAWDYALASTVGIRLREKENA